MKIKSKTNSTPQYSFVRAKFFMKRLLIFYLIISQSIINSEISVFNDNYVKKDEIFEKTPTVDVSSDIMYYDLGYFVNEENTDARPIFTYKYGLHYNPYPCKGLDPSPQDISSKIVSPENSQIRSVSEEIELFKMASKIDSSQEEPKLSCPCPVHILHNSSFIVTYVLQVYSDSGGTLNMLSSEDTIATFNVAGGDVNNLKVTIRSENGIMGKEVKMTFDSDSGRVTLPFIANETNETFTVDYTTDISDLYFIKYYVTWEDTLVKAGTEYTLQIYRSKNGLGTCSKESDCLLGHMCTGSICKPCHFSCFRCYQDDTNSNAKEMCTECSPLTSAPNPVSSVCPVNHVDITQFKDIDFEIKPKDHEFNERCSLGIWLFFSNLALSVNDNADIYHIVLKDRFVLSLLPDPETGKIGAVMHVQEDLFHLVTSETRKRDHFRVVKEDNKGNPVAGAAIDAQKLKEDTLYAEISVPDGKQVDYVEVNQEGLNSVEGRWLHFSVAWSLDHSLFYVKSTLNGVSVFTEKHMERENLYTNGAVESEIFLRHVVDKDTPLFLSLRNFEFSSSAVYAKFLFVFKEYLPPRMNYMYFDFSFVAADFSQFIFSAEFSRIEYDEEYFITTTDENGRREKFKLWPARKKVKIEASRNFKQLNLPRENQGYRKLSIIPSETKSLSVGEHMQFVYKDNKPLSCLSSFFLIQNSEQCGNCPEGKIAYRGVGEAKGYCDFPCSISMRCEQNRILDALVYPPEGQFCWDSHINSQTCSVSNIYNLFFSCEDKKRDNFFQFSEFYNSKNFEINLADDVFPERKFMNYILEFWFYPDFFLRDIERKNKSFFYKTYDKNYIFYSNVISLYYNEDGPQEQLYFKFSSDTGVGTRILGDGYFRYEWNHFLLEVKYEDLYYWRNITMNRLRVATRWKTNEDSYGALKYIKFCHGNCLDVYGFPIHWGTAYYRDLKVWDGDISNYAQTIQFEVFFKNSNELSSILVHYPLKNEYIANNIILSERCHGHPSEIKLESGTYGQKRYNYGYNFDYIQGYKESLGYYVKDTGGGTYEIDKCPEGCARCWDNRGWHCYQCFSEYFLTETNSCVLKRTFYFKSPSTTSQSEAKITFLSGDIPSTNSVTITFWSKPLGFGNIEENRYTSIVEIRPDNINTPSLYLEYSARRDDTNHPFGLSLKTSNNYIYANYKYFRNHMGFWTFFSISYHKQVIDSNQEVYFPAMMKLEINRYSFEVSKNDLKHANIFRFNQFVISPAYIGLFFDLKVYKQYLINSFGFETNKGNLKTPFSSPIPELRMLPVGTKEINCFDTTYLSSEGDFKCVNDQMTIYSQFNTDFNNYLDYDEETSGNSRSCTFKNGDTSKFSLKLNKCFNVCAGGGTQYCSCTNRNINSQLIIKDIQTSVNYCQPYDYINFAKTENITISKVVTAIETKRYTLQFWVFAYNYVNGKFGGLTFLWNGHNKIVISDCNAIMHGNDETTQCKVTCYPSIEKGVDPSPPENIYTNIIINRWNFISCAVNHVDKFYYLNINSDDGITLDNKKLLAPDPTNLLLTKVETTLEFSDDTKLNEWGYLFFKQIRLWRETYFNAAFLSRILIQHCELFGYLGNNWEPVFKGIINEYYKSNFYVKDVCGRAIDFNVNYMGELGANVIEGYKYVDVKLCSEYSQYYDSATEKCVQFTDAKLMEDITFNNIPYSYGGSYSIAFWIFFEDATTLTSGIHIQWKEMMQVSLVRFARLEAMCFPQAYYTDQIENTDISLKYSNALNKARVFLQDENTPESGKWIWVLCSMSNYNQTFFVNGNDPNKLVINQLERESLYKSTTTDEVKSYYSLKYFISKENDRTSLVIEGLSNSKKIYFRIVELFRDYIPYWYGFRYMNLKMTEPNTMPSILFVVNFADFNLDTKILDYYLYEKNGLQNYRKTKQTKTLNVPKDALCGNFEFLPLCELETNTKFRYDKTKNACVPIVDCDLTALKAHYCMDEGTPLCCQENYYINKNGKCQNYCSEEGYIRSPMSQANYGICNVKCGKNIDTCPGSGSSFLADFKTNYKCSTSSVRVGYQCVEMNLVSKSALFISRCYNNPNFYRTLTGYTFNQFNSGYFFEFWFKLDNILNTCTPVDKEYYLYSNPHSIYKDTATNKFYYKIVSTTYEWEISGISTYEWNKIIIKVDLASEILKQNIYFYLNFDFTNPKLFYSIPSSTNMQMKSFSFCSKFRNGVCSEGNPNIYWGSAYYRNFRIWDLRSSSLAVIQSFDRDIFPEIPKSLIIYYPLTVEYIDINSLTERISRSENIVATHANTNNFDSKDDMIFYNFATNFDWGEENTNNANKFVSSMNGLEITSSGCGSYCKRCYSAANNNCYECREGYALVETTCKLITGYYLKTPALTPSTSIPFNLLNEDGTKNVASLKTFTFCIYMKFIGVDNTSPSSQPKIISFSQSSYISYDISSTDLVFFVGGELAFRDKNFRKFFGEWIPLCVANYISGSTLDEIYPNMLTLSVNKEDIPFVTGYSLKPTGASIDRIALEYEIIALYANFVVYDRFIQGGFGRIASLISGTNRIINYALSSSSASGCLQSEQISGGNAVSVSCVPDYNVYLDTTLNCGDDTKYFDAGLTAYNPPCLDCNSVCTTLCFNEEREECTCDMPHALYWLRRDTLTRQTYCEYLPFIDYSILTDITMTVPSSANYESTLEVWVFIYSYNLNVINFKEINLEWSLHNKILISKVGNKIVAKCYAIYDSDNPGRYSESLSEEILQYKWTLLRCGTDLISPTRTMFFNYQEKIVETQDIPHEERYGKPTKFKIYNGRESIYNFGFVFLARIKLWQQYNKVYIDTSYVDLASYGIYDKSILKTKGLYPGLLAYIKSDFLLSEYENVKDNNKYKIINEMGNDLEEEIYYKKTWIANRKPEFIGYNYVDPANDRFYTTLPICPEGEVYNGSSDTCEKPEASQCQLAGDISGKCIKCPDERIYLFPVDGRCISECPEYYYPRDDINQCRRCHVTCYRCASYKEDECTQCTGVLYLVRLNGPLGKCVTSCQDYGLTISPVTPNLCVLFDADAELVNPHEYEPIDIRNFNSLTAQVTITTNPDYTTLWGWDPEDTINYNKIHKNVNDMEFKKESPFIGDLTGMEVKVDNTFFELNRYYIVHMDIISHDPNDINKLVTVTRKFYLLMNSYPVNGTLEIFPQIGLYNTTTFLLNCKNWVDDTTAELKYRFYSFEENTNEEILLRDWSSESDMTTNFTTVYYTLPQSKVTIKCQIKDNYDAITSVTSDIIVATNINDGIFYLNDCFNGYSIPTQTTPDLILMHHSQFLMSLGLDQYKVLQPTSFQTKYAPSLDKSMITKTDPLCTSNYCNNNGYCDLIDEYLVCHCNIGFIGRNCQIDKTGYNNLEKYFNELYLKVMGDLQTSITYEGFSIFHNLYFSASQFFQDPSFFSNKLDSFLAMTLQLFGNSFKNNTAEYIDLLDYYYSFTLTRINKEKVDQKDKAGLSMRNVTFNDDKDLSEYKEAFDYIHEELLVLLKFYSVQNSETKNKFEYLSNNFYLAVIPVTPTFYEENFFRSRIKAHMSYVKFMNCLNFVEINKLRNPNYNVFAIFIEYHNVPFTYDKKYYTNSTSPLVELKFIDLSTGKYITIDGCTDEKSIHFYLPFTSFKYLDEFNRQKDLYDPNNLIPPTSPIFTDPVYINESGYVSNDTIEERIRKYSRTYNFSCAYFDVSVNDYVNENINYLNFTEDTNYIVFNSSHSSKFTTFFVENNMTYETHNRFFYISRPRLLKWKPNYFEAFGSLLFFVLISIYLLLVLITTCYDKKFTEREGLLEFIKQEIVRSSYPYSTDNEKEQIINEVIPHKMKVGINPSNMFFSETNNNRIIPQQKKLKIGKFETNIDFESDELMTINKLDTEKTKVNGRKKLNKFSMFGEKKEKGNVNKFFSIRKNQKTPVTSKFFDNIRTYGREENDKEKEDQDNSDEVNQGKIGFNNVDAALEKPNEKFDPNKLPKEFEEDEEEENRRLRMYADLNLSNFQYYKANILMRNLFINPIFNVSLFHPRWKKLTLMTTDIAIISLMVSLFLTSDEKVLEKNIGGLIKYSILSMLISCACIFIINLLFLFPKYSQRRLYHLVTTGGQLIVLKEWEDISKTQRTKAIIGTILCCLIWIFSYYVSLGFTAVWKVQKWAYVYCMILTFVFNYIIFDLFAELFITLIYRCRKKGGKWQKLGDIINRLRNYKVLCP